MNKKIIAILFFAVVSISAYSTQIEDYFGKYQSINPNCKISFIFDEGGISNLSVNKIKINPNSIVVEENTGLSFDATIAVTIEFYDVLGNRHTMVLYMNKADKKEILTVGFYLRFDDHLDEEYSIVEKHALELVRLPLSD